MAVIILITLVQAFIVLDIQAVSAPALEIVNAIFGAIPSLILAVVVISCGLLVTNIVCGLLYNILVGVNFDGMVEPGTLIYNDLFKIYPFENQLFVVQMTGKEIKDYLEYSYGTWINTVSGKAGEHLLKMENKPDPRTGLKNWSFINRAYNFDSAGGLLYEVDIRKPEGERVNISALASGEAFSEDSTYNVAMTSYRASGGGGLMRAGAGIDTDRVDERVVARYPEIREIIYDYIGKVGTLTPEVVGNQAVIGHWEFVPEEISGKLIDSDMSLLFPGA